MHMYLFSRIILVYLKICFKKFSSIFFPPNLPVIFFLLWRGARRQWHLQILTAMNMVFKPRQEGSTVERGLSLALRAPPWGWAQGEIAQVWVTCAGVWHLVLTACQVPSLPGFLTKQTLPSRAFVRFFLGAASVSAHAPVLPPLDLRRG